MTQLLVCWFFLNQTTKSYDYLTPIQKSSKPFGVTWKILFAVEKGGVTSTCGNLYFSQDND